MPTLLSPFPAAPATLRFGQAAIAHAKSPTSSGTSTSKVLTGTVPSYLQGTALGTFLQAISSAGSSGSSTSKSQSQSWTQGRIAKPACYRSRQVCELLTF